MKKTPLSIILLTLCALYSITPLLIHQEFISGGWDLSTHISKAMQVSAGIREGIIYPRWLSMSNGGYGSPTMNFYSPLFYWITGVVNLIIPSLATSLKITIFSGFFLSGLMMYLFLRNFCGHAGSVTGGIAYQLLPYTIFDFYIRETLAEVFGLFWLPLIFHLAYKGATKDLLQYWIGLAFSYAGLILTHIASAYMFTFLIAAAALSFSVRGKNPKMLLKFMLTGLCGLSLSAFYFIPMFFERRFVHLEWLNERWDYMRAFLYIDETRLNPFYLHLDQMVKLQVPLVIISMILVYYKGRKSGNLSNLYQILFFSAVFAFSIFISTSLSLPIWEHTPGLSTTLFPWRWLMIATFAIAILIGLTIDGTSLSDIRSDRFIRICMAVFYAVLIGNIYLSSAHIGAARPTEKRDIEQIIRDGVLIEYRPIWFTDKEKDFSREPWIPVIFKDGEGTVDVISWKSQSRTFRVDATLPSVIRVSTFYYPGWTALINGNEIPIAIEKDSGAMLLNIPSGENEVLLEFRDTSLRRTAKWISIISLFAALTCLIVPRFKRPL